MNQHSYMQMPGDYLFCLRTKTLKVLYPFPAKITPPDKYRPEAVFNHLFKICVK